MLGHNLPVVWSGYFSSFLLMLTVENFVNRHAHARFVLLRDFHTAFCAVGGICP